MTLSTEADITCSTAGLDDPEARDYIGGQEAVFTREDEGMEGCYEAVLGGGPVTGSVIWTGTGLFAAFDNEICVDISAEADPDTWCCQTEGFANAGQVVPLVNCQLK